MAICTNCNTNLSCGCQRRTASDGKECCTECIQQYEAKIQNIKIAPLPPEPKNNG
jgi:hypothetical protein